MNNPTASIVIPVFNRAQLVHRAIDSALNQTYPCEVILVDHGSTDDINSVVAKYAGKIRYIRRDTDNGPIAAWRDGAEQATGEFLHFTYDDDWIQPTFIEKCLNCFNENIAFVYTRATIHDFDAKTQHIHLLHPAGIHAIEDVVHFLLYKPLTISPGAALFRRRDVLENLLNEIPDANGIYGKNSGVGEDLLLFLLTSLKYEKYAHIPEPLADFLAHPGSITINATQTGKAHDLANSYLVAKQYYLQHQNSIQPLFGIRFYLFKLSWHVRSLMSLINSSAKRDEPE